MKVMQFGSAASLTAVAILSLATAVAPRAAQASPSKVHFYTSNGGFSPDLVTFGLSPDSNILFNVPSLISTGNPVQGNSNTNPKFIVDFKDAGGVNLHEDAHGQSDIEAQSGTYHDLTIYLDDPNAMFQSLSFQVNPASGVQGNVKLGTDNITLTGVNLDTTTSTLDIYNAGENFFGVIVEPGTESLKSVTISGNVDFSDIRQFRMGGIVKGDIVASPVPEPGTLALLASGALPLAGALRRRRKV